MDIIRTENIDLKYGTRTILDGVSLSVQKGQICGLVGNNGAGKTTLLKVITGLVTGYSGKVFLNGQLSSYCGSDQIGVVMDDISPAGVESVKSYFHHMYLLNGPSGKTEQELLEFVKLNDHEGKTVSKLSLGMKQRLKIACALMGKTQMLILDEPFNGLDPEGKIGISQLLKQLAEAGHTILITSHEIDQLVQFADRFVVMHMGKIISDLSFRELTGKKRNKYVVSTLNNTASFIGYVKEKRNDLICYSSQDGKVSVFGKPSLDEVYNICSSFGIDGKDIEERPMSEKDHLLLMMEGINYG